MHTWTVSIDRRTDRRDEILGELGAFGFTVDGLTVDIFESQRIDAPEDQGRFRDFVPVATMSHEHQQVLETLAEELLDMFGWLIDFREPPRHDLADS